MITAHELSHAIAEYWYGDKLLFTSSARDIDKNDYNYTAAFNKDKTRASYFFSSKDIFFKWEDNNKGNNAVELFIYKALKGEHEIIARAKYKPVGIKEK